MIRLYNCRLLSMNGNMDITNDEVWTDKDKIVYVGPAVKDMPAFHKEYDLKGNVLMPGFKNAHTHSPMTFLRSYADDLPLDDWLNKQVFPMEARLNDDGVYTFTQLAILEYLSSGITSAFDMYFYSALLNSQAAVDMGFRMVHCGAVNNFCGSVEQMEKDFVKFNGYDPLISYQLGFHAEYTTSINIMNDISALAHKYKAPVSVHCSETKQEVEDCIGRYGKTPVRLFEDLGLWDFGGTIFHGVWLTDEDIQIIKKRGVTVAANPGSNCKLASGISHVTRLLAEGINVALGTDGPASNNALDMFREMYLLTALQKIQKNDASAMPAYEVLKIACQNGAYAMGTDNDCIAEGKLADMIVIDLQQPNMQPLNNIAKNIVYSGSKSNVKMTMVGGRILYQNGVFATDAQNIYKKANRLNEGIKNK